MGWIGRHTEKGRWESKLVAFAGEIRDKWAIHSLPPPPYPPAPGFSFMHQWLSEGWLSRALEELLKHPGWPLIWLHWERGWELHKGLMRMRKHHHNNSRDSKWEQGDLSLHVVNVRSIGQCLEFETICSAEKISLNRQQTSLSLWDALKPISHRPSLNIGDTSETCSPTEGNLLLITSLA